MLAARTEPQVRRRIEELERAFGDPCDGANPLGMAALAEADRRNELPAAGERALDAADFASEFVPVALGGRLDRADVLARVLRPVFRRDVALGFGYGITSLFAASAVWAAGTEQQRGRTARTLLGGGRLSIVHHSLAHGNAMWRGELVARRTENGYVLNGRKDAVLNAERSAGYVVYARTEPGRGPRSHSVLLLDARERPPAGLRVLPRQLTTGMRGCRFAGLELTDRHLPPDSVVGRPGDGTQLALRTFQLNRALVSSVVLGAGDTALRSAVAAVTAEGAKGPGKRQRQVLAGVFADLLWCDAMATVVLRSLHVLPDSAHLGAAAVKYLVPDLVREDLEELGTVLGASDSLRQSGLSYVHKLLRDLPAAGLGHLGTAACQAVLLPQLPGLARDSWGVAEEPPPSLFRAGPSMPPLEMGRLAVAGGTDFLAASLNGALPRLGGDAGEAGPYREVLVRLTESLIAELQLLRREFGAMPAGDRAVLARPEACALADRYAHVAAAGAVLGFWTRQDGTDPFLADPAWLVLALSRLGGRLGLKLPALPPDCVDRVFGEVVARYRSGRAYDLHAGLLAGSGGVGTGR
ncbi:acyl-CoA dehydrogenase [Streptomyces flavidovirens]|uniref:acyl-CoA dehydrogenase n=1 Tax=Streptomyces flavidovirens TaxID=67298 RepID=UPI0009989169|nr:acyl-CoA dehydrogenase [Streptomyces flavidovirens]